MNIKIYLNRNNVLTFGLLEDRTPVDVRSATRVILQFRSLADDSVVSIDSNTVPALFDLTSTKQFSGEVTGVLKLKLGGVAGVAVGKYLMTIVVYDAINTGGIAWAAMNAQVVNDAA
jgi:hypothetical protein